MQWSNRTPVLPRRATLLSVPAEQGVREMATRRLTRPCDILVTASGSDPFGGAGSSEDNPVIIGSVLCDIEPFRSSADTPPAGFENEKLYNIYLPADQDVPLSARIKVPGWLEQWSPSQTVALGAKRIATGEFGNNHYFECVRAGTTGPEEPLWDCRAGAKTMDGGAVWQEAGGSFTYEVKNGNAARSRETIICMICQLLQ